MVALTAVALVGAVVVVAFLLPDRADRAEARRLLANSLTTLAAGNYSAARTNAQSAIAADRTWALPHAVLARAYLSLGEGLAAEAALARARAAGVAADRLHQLAAHAALLQGDPDRALVEAARTMPRYAGYAVRVRALALGSRGDLPRARLLLEERLRAEPRDVASWTTLGRLRLQTGDVGGADAATTRALTLDRRLPESLLLKGEIVRTRFGLVAALPWFDAALARDGYFHPALIERAAILGELGRHAEMLAATRAALAARPGSGQALYLQAVLAARAGRLDLARGLLARVGRSMTFTPGVLLLGGALNHAAGHYERAIGQWRLLVGRQPMNLTARRLLGTALLRSGDPRGALDILRPLALRDDADGYTLALVARGFELTGERGWAARFRDRSARAAQGASRTFSSDSSLPVLAEAVGRAPGDPAPAVALIRGYLDVDNLAAAVTSAQALAIASPGAPAAHRALGDSLAAAGRDREAAIAYARAADLDFSEPTMLRLIDAFDRAGRGDSGARALALYLSQNPRSVTGRRLLATRQLAARDYPAAIETLEELRRRLGARDVALLADLAYAYAGAGDGAVALRYGRAAYALAPMNPVAADAYGWALYQADRPRAAVQLLHKATTLAPAHGGIRWHLAQALAESGRATDARRAIDATLADPRFPDRAAAAALMKALP